MPAHDAPYPAGILTLSTASGSHATVYTHGAQVMSWKLRGRERLFTSPRANFSAGQAIRGGIPVIFPQFGDGPGLRHGFARLLEWKPDPVVAAPNRATLELVESNQSLKWWPHRFRATLEVELLDDRLSSSLTITNCDDSYFDFTAALHTYLRVSNIDQTEVLGLQGLHYVDACSGNRIDFQLEPAVRFAGEVDRVYIDSGSRELSVHDASSVTQVLSKGFADAVIWNPGAELAAGMNDLGPDNHTHFICLERGTVKAAVRLAPGTAWIGGQTLLCID